MRAQLEALLAREPAASRESILQAWQATADALQTPSATMPRIVAACLRDQPCDLVQMLSGWIIVALGTMLGAPFWFDLLGRLVKLRGAGGRPSDEGAGAVPGAEGKGPGTGMLAPATRRLGDPRPRWPRDPREFRHGDEEGPHPWTR